MSMPLFAAKEKAQLPEISRRVLFNFMPAGCFISNTLMLGPIEKGATDGQTVYCNDLIKALKAGVSRRGAAGGTKGKTGRKRKVSSRGHKDGESGATGSAASKTGYSWIEPLRALISPLTDLLPSLINAHTIIGVLLFTIVLSYFRSSPSSLNPSHHDQDHALFAHQSISHAARIAAYEEIWRREESAMWDWLDKRMGQTGPRHHPNNAESDMHWKPPIDRGRQNGEHALLERLGSAKQQVLKDVEMTEHEIERAIRATEEKLLVLKAAIKEKKLLEDGDSR